MCLIKWLERQRKRRRERIYESPSADIDGGVRIRRDTDAPKEIESVKLLRFSCSFSTVSLEEQEGLGCGVYSFSASIDGDSISRSCSLRGRENLEKCKEKCSDTFLDELEELIRKNKIADYNGNYYKVSGLPDFYGATVSAEYESGESIYCYNNQDPFLPIPFMRELCRLFGI